MEQSSEAPLLSREPIEDKSTAAGALSHLQQPDIVMSDASKAEPEAVKKEKWSLSRLLGGRYLPTVIDNVRNNVRNRPLLLGIYSLTACFIALILLLAVDVQDTKTWDCSFYGTPQSSAAVGMPFRDFSIILRDANHIGVEGETAYALILPTSTMSVEASLRDSSTIPVEDVACVVTILEPGSGFSDLANMLCSPQSYGMLLNNESRTNARGIAVFSNFTIGFAAPGNYLLVVGIKGYAITSMTTLTIAPLLEVQLESVNPTDWLDREVKVKPIGGSSTDEAMTIVMKATWSAPLSPPPAFICGALVSLNLQKAVGQSLQVLNPIRDTEHKLLELSGSVLCLRGGWKQASWNTSAAAVRYTATFNFSTFQLHGSNSLDMFLGFAALGVVVPLSSNTSEKQVMPEDSGFPAEVIHSVRPVSAVQSLSALSSVSGPPPTQIIEGQPLRFAFQVNPPEAGHVVYVHASPSANNSLQVMSWQSPAADPKRMLFAEAVSDNNGVAWFDVLQFSVSGSIGFYDVYAICDGIAAAWPNANSGNNGSQYWTIAVASAVDAAMSQVIVLTSAETVLVPWSSPPLLRVLDVNGNPLAGKVATIMSTSPAIVGVTAESRRSDAEGLIQFSLVEILFLATNSSIVAGLKLVCDNVEYPFQITVAHQASPSYISGQCSSVTIRKSPSAIFPHDLAWAGTPFVLQVVALDPFGQPTTDTVALDIAAAYQEPPPGLSLTTITATADPITGIALFNLTIRLPVARRVVMAARCNSFPSAMSSSSSASFSAAADATVSEETRRGSTFAAVFTPRFSAVSTNAGSSNNIVVDLTSSFWWAVSSEIPIVVTLSALCFPMYVVSHFSPSVMTFPTRYISSAASSIISFNASELNTPVGVFVLNAVVDGVRAGGQARYNFTAGAPPNIKVIQSAFFDVQNVTAGTVLLPPSVQLTYTNIPMYVRVLFLLRNGSWVEVDIAENPASIVFGLIVTGQGFAINQDSLKLQSLGKSDSTGKVTFPFFTIIAVSPAVQSLLFSYCAVAPIAVCVNDTLTNVTNGLPQNYSISVPSLNAAPGQRLPTFYVTNPQLPLFACVPLLNGHVSQILEVDNGLSDFSVRNVVTPSPSTSANYYLSFTTLSLTSDTPPTTSSTSYTLEIICPGQELAPIPLVVDSQVHSAVVKGLPKSSPVELQSLFSAQVTLLSSIGSPLSGIAVTLYVVSTKGDSCAGASCGKYSGDVQTTISDDTGTASFSLMMQQGASGKYMLAFAANQDDIVSGRQFISQQALHAAADIGMREASAAAFLQRAFPNMEAIRVLIEVLLSFEGRLASSDGQSQSTPVLLRNIASPLVTAPFTLLNPVASVVILAQPALGPFQLQFQINSIVAAAQAVPTIFEIDDPTMCPRVQFFDAEARPVGGAAVTVDVFQVGLLGSLSPTNLLLVRNISHLSSSPDDGTVSICGFTLSALVPGTFVLYITSNGGGGNFTSMSFEVTQSSSVTATDLMKYFAAFFTIFFSPMLFSTVPFSRPLYMVTAVLCGVVTLLGSSNGLWNLLPNHSAFYLVYFTFICICAGLVTAAGLAIVLLDTLGYKYNVHRCRVVNDESKALLTFQYTMWLVNISPDKQAEQLAREEAESEGLQRELKTMVNNRLEQAKQHAESSTIVKAVGGAKKKLSDAGILHFDESAKGKNSSVKAGKIRKPVFLYNRDDLDPVYLPINFLIVVAISLVLIVLMNCIVYSYVFPFLQSKISIFVSYFPSIDKGSEAEVEAVVMQFIAQMASAIADQFPQYSSITSIIRPLSDLNVVQILTNISQLADSLLTNVEIAFIVGGAAAFTSYAVTITMMVVNIPQMTREIRRGTCAGTSSIAATESYTGQHSVQLILYYLLVFALVSVLIFVLLFDAIRTFLFNTLSVVILGSAISWVIKQFMQVVVVDRFLTQGNLIVRPELYSIWHLVGLFLGVFSSLITSITRWGMSVGFTTLLFARLDYCIFPPAFSFMDATHNGFLSMVTANAKNSNPIAMMFASILITEQELRRQWRSRRCDNNDDDKNFAVDDKLFADKPLMAPSVKNIARIYVRHLSGNPVALTARPTVDVFNLKRFADDEREASKTRTRVANRFWLWFLLSKNPQLRALRKVPIVEVETCAS